MPNVWKRTTNFELVSTEIYELAATEVIERNISLRKVAEFYRFSHVSLYRYIKKKKKMNEEDKRGLPTVGYTSCKRVFSNQEEAILRDYLLHCSAVNYGLNTKEVRIATKS